MEGLQEDGVPSCAAWKSSMAKSPHLPPWESGLSETKEVSAREGTSFGSPAAKDASVSRPDEII